MFRKPLLLLIFPLLCLLSFIQPEDTQGKWITLFDGKTLNGWTPKVAGYPLGENALDVFRAEKGMLRVAYDKYDKFDNRFGHIFYKDSFSSFILRMEYRFVGEMLPDAPSYCYRNSGVMFHSQSAESMDFNQYWPISLETQLLSSTDSVKQTTANMCTPGTTVHIDGKFTDEHCIASDSRNYPDNEWIKLEIVVHGSRMVHHIINGDTVLSFSKPQIGGYLYTENYPLPVGTVLEGGYIALQAEGQPIDFRKIQLKVLEE
jgi:hypothetical protein